MPLECDLEQILAAARRDRLLGPGIACWKRFPARPAACSPFPDFLDGRLKEALARRGIANLYRHQSAALEAARRDADVMVVTPTASGKSLCYHLPVIDVLLRDPRATALYVFPAKALARDQMDALLALTGGLLPPLAVGAYDGDTPPEARRSLRRSGRMILTNPDMLHRGLLPGNTVWGRFLQGLRFVILDEMHVYHGLFGGHVANVLRRLDRIARLHGARPRFLCGSATIANPLELARALTGREPVLIDGDGAPRGERHLIVYNPFRDGVRRRPPGIEHLLHTREWARRFLCRGVQTIVFARNRLDVERLVRDLRSERLKVCGYRADYLPEARREREAALRAGAVTGVVTTNALELGIDVGSLDAAVLSGYPDSLAATWQQAGRVGRKAAPSAVILVAGPGPLDQFVAEHPEFLWDAPPEQARLDPDNPILLAAHLTCAAAEHPLRPGEPFGGREQVRIIEILERAGRLRPAGDGWKASAREPARCVDLRTGGGKRVEVWEASAGSPEARLLCRLDGAVAPFLLYEGAVYLHDGRSHRVERVDPAAGRAYVRPASGEEGETATRRELQVSLLAPGGGTPGGETPQWGWAPARVSVRPAAYLRRDRRSGAVTGWGPIESPGHAMETGAYWCAFPARWSRLPRHLLAGAAQGLARLLSSLSALFLLCGRNDLLAAWQAPSPATGRVTVYLCDACPGGAGLAPRLADLHGRLLPAAAGVIRRCPCEDGCPACLGPVGRSAKRAALALLEAALCEARPGCETQAGG